MSEPDTTTLEDLAYAQITIAAVVVHALDEREIVNARTIEVIARELAKTLQPPGAAELLTHFANSLGAAEAAL